MMLKYDVEQIYLEHSKLCEQQISSFILPFNTLKYV